MKKPVAIQKRDGIVCPGNPGPLSSHERRFASHGVFSEIFHNDFDDKDYLFVSTADGHVLKEFTMTLKELEKYGHDIFVTKDNIHIEDNVEDR